MVTPDPWEYEESPAGQTRPIQKKLINAVIVTLKRKLRAERAYLGPEGTYTHQAAVERFAHAQVVLEPQRTISETFGAALAPEGEARIAFIPWENSEHGQVLDTYDALRTHSVGVRARVCGEHTIGIEHCLVVRAGTRLADVRRVLSHEQALGQCKRFLEKELPAATIVRVASTAAAAQAIASSTSPTASADAAICAKICAKLYAGLEILRIGIQDSSSNRTRFMIVAPRKELSPPGSGRRRGLIRVADEGGRVATIVGCVGLHVRQLDRRPSLRQDAQDYFVEVEAEGDDDEGAWTASVEAAARRVQGTVLGVWRA